MWKSKNLVVVCRSKCMSNNAKVYNIRAVTAALLAKIRGIRYYITDMPKRTHQPHTRHRARTHGFRARIATKAGRAVIKRRRIKGRAKLTV